MSVCFFDSRNVQKRATKSDTSGHCLPHREEMTGGLGREEEQQQVEESDRRSVDEAESIQFRRGGSATDPSQRRRRAGRLSQPGPCLGSPEQASPPN